MLRMAVLATVFAISCLASFAQDNPDREDPVDPGIPSQLLIEQLSGNLPGAALDDVAPKPILQSALDLIKAYEGWSSTAYDDPVGYCTIGYGHLIRKDRCADSDLESFTTLLLNGGYLATSPPVTLKLSRDAGNRLLAADTVPARKIIGKLVTVVLTKRQFGALTSFVFNVGGANFARSQLLERVNEGDFKNAARELRKWVKAGGRRLQGLVNRRNCEISLFNGADLPRLANGRIDTKTCAAELGAAPDSSETIDIVTGKSGS